MNVLKIRKHNILKIIIFTVGWHISILIAHFFNVPPFEQLVVTMMLMSLPIAIDTYRQGFATLLPHYDVWWYPKHDDYYRHMYTHTICWFSASTLWWVVKRDEFTFTLLLLSSFLLVLNIISYILKRLFLKELPTPEEDSFFFASK